MNTDGTVPEIPLCKDCFERGVGIPISGRHADSGGGERPCARCTTPTTWRLLPPEGVRGFVVAMG